MNAVAKISLNVRRCAKEFSGQRRSIVDVAGLRRQGGKRAVHRFASAKPALGILRQICKLLVREHVLIVPQVQSLRFLKMRPVIGRNLELAAVGIWS